jgi:O-acetyl-ADP-ribose deacetylase (regulator of RNase III)
MKNYLTENDFVGKIGFPKLGCGLAGGDWNFVSEIIKEVFYDQEVFVYELD